MATDELQLTAALQLGWRIAELYARVDDPGDPVNDTLLPAHQSLEPADQIELQLRAAAGDARRAGLESQVVGLQRLVPYARAAPQSWNDAELFRRELRSCHVELDKELWARDEAAGKAYELGNGLSDTYSRISRAYRGSPDQRELVWLDVFDAGRIERLKKLLDDLQSRLDSEGVHVVRDQLEAWKNAVPDRLRGLGEPPSQAKVTEWLRRQTIVWRQLITGDKAPEAYLDSDARATLRDDFRALAWRRGGKWIGLAAGALFALVLWLPDVVAWSQQGGIGAWIASAVTAVAGALGITRASVALAARTQLDRWSELLWHRALAEKVSDATLFLDAVLPPLPPARGAVLHAGVAKVKEVCADTVAPLRPARRTG